MLNVGDRVLYVEGVWSHSKLFLRTTHLTAALATVAALSSRALAAPDGGTLSCLIAATQFRSACAVDCSLDGRVTVDELVNGVRIILGDRHLRQCPGADLDEDGQVTVNEIVAGIGRAHNGCLTPAPSFEGDVAVRASGHRDVSGTATMVRLDLITREDYPCFNFRIPYAAQVVGNQVNLTLGCVYELSGICLTALGPATADLTVALTDGTYTLNLVGAAQTDRYELTVDGADVQLHALD